MKNYLLIATFSLANFFCIAQNNASPKIAAVTALKTTPFNTGDPGMAILDMDLDPSNGDVYVVVNMYTSVTFSPGVLIFPSNDGNSIVLAKYDSGGNFKWLKNLGYLGWDYAFAHVAADGAGGAYITAPFSVDSVDFGDNVKVQRHCAGGCQELFLARISGNGFANWANTIKATGATLGNFSVGGLECNATGPLYLGGNYEGGKVDFGGSLAFTNLPVRGLFLATYDRSTGQALSVHFASNQISDLGGVQHMKLNHNNQLILAGEFEAKLSFDNGLALTAPSGTLEHFVAGLSADGNTQWLREIGTSDFLEILGMDIDEQGNAYLAIDASENITLDGNTILSINTTYEGTIIKINGTEHSIPVAIPYDADDYPIMDVNLDELDNIYTVGFISEPLNLGSINLPVVGCLDGLVTITDKNGVLKKARTFGGGGCEALVNDNYGTVTGFDNAGNLYAAGGYLDNFSADGISIPGFGAFIAKFNTGSTPTFEPQEVSDLFISPNPGQGDFHLVLENFSAEKALLQIRDMDGRTVYQQMLGQSVTDIETDLPSGAYILTVQDGNHLYRQKMIVQR